MRSPTLHLILLLLLTGFIPKAAGQAVEIRKISVDLNDDNVTVSVDLTDSVTPSIIIATSPDRLVLQLPNTAAPPKQQSVTVNQNGVKGVRVGLNQAAPPISRVVVDLNTVHPYQLAMNGHKITLTVLPISTTPGTTLVKQSSGGILARLWKRQSNPAPSSNTLLPAAQRDLRTRFLVKYVAEGAAYLNGGRSSGLAPGMKLVVRDPILSTRDTVAPKPPVAELQVIFIAQNSAVTEIHSAKRAIKTGDWAYLSAEYINRM